MSEESRYMNNNRLLLTVKEAAQQLAISERTLWQLTKDRQIRSVRIRRAVRYDPTDLLAWIERSKTSA